MSAAEDRMVAMVYTQREKIEAAFKEFDEDGSGTVSEEEFAIQRSSSSAST
jgi:Ca2+-binding EF-hand superfamily protein